MGDWVGVAIVFGVAVSAFLLKFMIIKCCANHYRCRRGDSNHISWTDVEEGPSLEAFVIGDVHIVRCSGRNKGPPPKFEKALKCSTPVHPIQHFTDLGEDGLPTYEEYMRSQAALFRIASSSVEVETQVEPESFAEAHSEMKDVALQCASRNLVPHTENATYSTSSRETPKTTSEGSEPT